MKKKRDQYKTSQSIPMKYCANQIKFTQNKKKSAFHEILTDELTFGNTIFSGILRMLFLNFRARYLVSNSKNILSITV